MTDEDLLDIIAGLEQRIDDLTRAQGGGAPAAAPPAPPPTPRWWRQRATPDDWNDLEAWVQDLTDSGSLSDQYKIPTCWRQHPGFVEDLAAVYEAWVQAMIAQQAGARTSAGARGPGSIEASMWFTQGLWPLLDRFAAHRYAISQCAPEHLPD